MKIAPGVTLNFSKSGVSASFGPRGAKFTVGPRGTRQTIGIPGTGIYYTTAHGYGPKKAAPRAPAAQAPAPGTLPGLNLGFFQRLVTPENEKAFIEGCKEIINGNPEGALAHFDASRNFADAAFMGGIVSFKLERYADAVERFNEALNMQNQLGALLGKHGLEAGANIPITDEIIAFAAADRRGVLLALTEVYQRSGKTDDALKCLYELRKLEPNDPLINLSLVELYVDSGEMKDEQLKAVLNLTKDAENESAVHAALLLYRAKAMRLLGLNEAALEVLKKGMGRKKDRPAELLLALRYERGLVYESAGKPKQAGKDFEKIYAEAPDFEDVSEKLGLKPG